jgi:uncharacterized membrane protein YccC
MTYYPGRASIGTVSRVKTGRHFPLHTLPPWAEVRTVAVDSVVLGVSCLVSFWLTARVLSFVYSVSAADDALGGLWAVVATVFVFRDTYDKSMTAALSRMAATLVSFVLPFHPWGLAIAVGLSVLVTAMIGRPQDEITAAITTTVVLVVAGLSPHDAWRQPILRLADTAIGVAVGLAAAWVGLHSIRPLIRPQEPHHPDQP